MRKQRGRQGVVRIRSGCTAWIEPHCTDSLGGLVREQRSPGQRRSPKGELDVCTFA